MIDRGYIRRRGLLGGAAAGMAAAAARPAWSLEPGPFLLELFTSQGCSASPPADKLIGEFMRRPDVVTLAFHVDYWDYIGWKDPFSSPMNTQRQHTYAKTLKQRYVYCPEMVFHGLLHDPGRDSAQIERLLKETRDATIQRKIPRANPLLARAGGNVTVTLPGAQLDGGVEIWLISYDPEHRTKVMRGENAGATLTNYNVVRVCERVAAWDGTPGTWSVPIEKLGAGRGVVGLVQYSNCGPVIGVAKMAA